MRACNRGLYYVSSCALSSRASSTAKGGSVKASGCQQRARAMRLRYIVWWWRSHERKPTRFGNGFGRCLASVSTSQ